VSVVSVVVPYRRLRVRRARRGSLLAPSCSSCPSWFATRVFVSVVSVVVRHRRLGVRRARRGSPPKSSCPSCPS
jgi:hypothetical protein